MKDHSVSKLACGLHHTIMLLDNANVWGCGRADNCQLGRVDLNLGDYSGLGDAGGFVNSPILIGFPVDEEGFRPRMVDVACGDNTSFAWTSSGAVYSWGYNEYRQSGHKKEQNQELPKRIPLSRLSGKEKDADTRILRVSSGAQHTLMVVKRYNK